MELLAPAGNIEKLKTAYIFGADAVYIGIKNFSLRAKADNFEKHEYKEIKKIKKNKKLYGALNIFFHDADLKNLEQEMDYIKKYPLDAFIISDIGLLPLLKKNFPATPLHLSTQASCLNSETAKYYQDLGFSRIILARELHLKEIDAIKKAVTLEIEVFVHGAMCLAYSGRCFLSAYMAERSANKGDCAHSCRWNYRVLEEEERKGVYFPIIQGDNFTTILSSKDLCMIHHLDKLRNAGVDALKIEGRMKSVYYTAIVTRAYRKALDVLEKANNEDISPYINELNKVSHREFWTGFYLDNFEIQKPTLKSYIREYTFLGSIGKRIAKNVYKLEVKNQIQTNDTLEYIGFDVLYLEDNNFTLLDKNKNVVAKADHGKEYYIKTAKTVKPGYLIRKKL